MRSDHMTMRWLLALLVATLASASSALAQDAAPITVTPRVLRPDAPAPAPAPDLPLAAPLEAPKGAEDLALTPGPIEIDGAFSEMAGANAAAMSALSGRRVTLREIYAAASALEAAYARAGFVLARVSVPPQALREGGPVRIVVTDGTVEAIVAEGVPARVRRAVRARLGGLIGLRHMRLAQIEQALVLAGDAPGLTLRSALAPGDRPGGARLVVEGTHKLVSGSLSAENNYDDSLDTYGANLQVSLNSLLGLGEQFYGFAGSGYDVTRFFSANASVRVLGGGVLVPLDRGRTVLNPEFTVSRTRPNLRPGVPQTSGLLRRMTLRADRVLERSRYSRAAFSATLERMEERNDLLEFGVPLSFDRYTAVRIGLSAFQARPGQAALSTSVVLSQGLAAFGATRPETSVQTGTPFSRQGAQPDFTKLQASVRLSARLGRNGDLTASVSTQAAFGKPLYRAEQFSLEGSEGASAFVGGATAVDEGIVVRLQPGFRTVLGQDRSGLVLAPYVFAAGGYGRINAPTALEPGSILAGSVGFGIRASLAAGGPSLQLEYAHGASDYQRIAGVDRVNLSAVLRF